MNEQLPARQDDPSDHGHHYPETGPDEFAPTQQFPTAQYPAAQYPAADDGRQRYSTQRYPEPQYDAQRYGDSQYQDQRYADPRHPDQQFADPRYPGPQFRRPEPLAHEGGLAYGNAPAAPFGPMDQFVPQHLHVPQPFAQNPYPFGYPPQPMQQTVFVNNGGGKRVNHALHLVLTIITAGLWLPVWIILAIANS